MLGGSCAEPERMDPGAARAHGPGGGLALSYTPAYLQDDD